jgi:hypothetical protein
VSLKFFLFLCAHKGLCKHCFYCFAHNSLLSLLHFFTESFLSFLFPNQEENVLAKKKAYEKMCVQLVLIKEGTFHGNGSSVNISYPLMIIGAGRNKTFLDGYRL